MKKKKNALQIKYITFYNCIILTFCTNKIVNINSFVKAVIINFGDERGDIIVKNDNFGTKRKYADFTNGKKEAGLNPMQIVFSGLEFEHIMNTRYIDKNDNVCTF